MSNASQGTDGIVINNPAYSHQKDCSGHEGRLHIHQSDSRHDAVRASCDNGKDNIKHVSDVGRDHAHDMKDLSRDQLESKVHLQDKSHDNKFTSLQNKCDLESKLSQCCCEMKEAVRAESQATRDLINATVTQQLRDQVASLNQASTIRQVLRELGIPAPVALRQ